MKISSQGLVTLCLFTACSFGQTIPEWVKFGGSYQARGQFSQSADFNSGAVDNLYFGRLRVYAEATPRPGLDFYVEGQDARVAGLADEFDAAGLHNLFDFRQGWVRLGSEDSPLQLKAGRQELSFGDERLIGSDNFFDPLGFTWDAAQLTYKRGELKIRTFAAWKVTSLPQSMDRPDTQRRLYGVYMTLPKFRKGFQLEPYVFFSQQTRQKDEDESVANRIGVFGFRSIGNLTSTLDYNVEMVAERGVHRDQTMRAWAGHWELGWRLGRGDRAPRLDAEYNRATGDHNPNDKVRSTFNDLYPAGYNAYGMADPFAWRNISNPALRLEIPLTGKWEAFGGWRSYSLNTVQDGLYIVGEECLTHNSAASSSFVGQQVSIAAAWNKSEHWKFNAGYSRLFSGPYLQQSGFSGQFSSAYLALTFLF